MFDNEFVSRFESRVQKGADNACWPWGGGIQKSGSTKNAEPYGTIRYKNKNVYAHRAAWMLLNGPVPHGLFVCHHCDNGLCCNPAHLFVGTHSDNMNDMYTKGREPFKFRRRLSDRDARYIRASCYTQRKLAEMFGLSQMAIWSVIHRRTYKHVLPRATNVRSRRGDVPDNS